MRNRTLMTRKAGMAGIVVLLLLSCSIVSPVPATPTPAPSPTSSPVPSATSAPGALQVDYTYTSNLITVLYPLYGSKLDDFVIVTITNPRSTPAQVIVESEVTGYTTQSIDTVTVDANGSLEVRQNPRLIPDVIDQLNDQKPATFHIRVVELDNGVEKPILEETQDTLIYGRRDFPWSIPGFTDAEVYDLVASMVTPTDPAVEELIRYAANYTSSGTITSGYGGYANDENNDVWDRLAAIWQAEEDDYHLTYISTTVSFAPGSVQRIRLPYEVLEQASGNCIETTLLYASAAEAMGLQSVIVLIPGHAYVGVRTDDQNDKYYFIETTLIGRSTFQEAVDTGNQEFQDALPHIDANEVSYGWVSIADARQNGILPLPVH